MLYMLVRNKVENYAEWKRVGDAQAEANRAAGLTTVRLWRDAADENTVWFLLEVEDMERAKKYIEAPESAEVGRRAGVLDGEFHFIESVD
ncbi:MAG TPA: hypothetical protein VGC76_07895 [Pyrinomonadaceae bacterium]|jgi:hypothetical protein